MAQDLVDDPVKGVAFCNENIKAIEAEMADADPDVRLKLRNQLLGFTELLEKFIHQKNQQGYDTQDVAKGSTVKTVRKKRFEST